MKIRNCWFLVVLGISLFATAPMTHAAAVQYFLKIDGVDGESTVKGHEKEIRITGYDLAADDQGLTSFGVEKALDAATTEFLSALASGSAYATATLYGVNNAKFNRFVVKIEFTKLVVTSVHSADTGADTAPSEKVTFSFKQATITYYQSGPKGEAIPHTVTIVTPGPAPNC